jgi:hypothetical protein
MLLCQLSKDIHDENEEISYTWVREYLWDVQPNANDPGTYLVSFDNGTASYLVLHRFLLHIPVVYLFFLLSIILWDDR